MKLSVTNTDEYSFARALALSTGEVANLPSGHSKAGTADLDLVELRRCEKIPLDERRIFLFSLRVASLLYCLVISLLILL